MESRGCRLDRTLQGRARDRKTLGANFSAAELVRERQARRRAKFRLTETVADLGEGARFVSIRDNSVQRGRGPYGARRRQS